MLTRPNFQRLLDVVKATEIQYTTHFEMAHVMRRVFRVGETCGTAGCLIGNYNLFANRPVDTYLFTPIQAGCRPAEDWNHFGITLSEYNWLFSESVRGRSPHGPDRFRRDLSKVTKEQALSRLRKFIYYKLHKQEMILDERGVREEARQAEGDHGFANRAVLEAQEAGVPE